MRSFGAAASPAAGVALAGSLCLAADADVIHVPGDEPTIQAGIDAAMDGDEVVVADGVYTGPGNRELQVGDKLITVRSAGGPTACIIDCEAAGRAFVIDGGAHVDGFTVRNGVAPQGAAMLIGGDTTIVGCVFEGNTADLGGSVYITSSSPTFIRCTFIDNCAVDGDGGAIYNLYGDPAFFNCLIAGNCATDLGGAIFSDLAGLSLINCTFSDNTAYSGGGIANYAGVTMTLSNCILWGNHATTGDAFSAQILSTSSREIVNYTCIEGLDGAFGGDGNIATDPLFVGRARGDYRLGPGSPCIDAGDNTAVREGSDLGGNPRLVDDPCTDDTGNPDGINPLVDMGAHEFQGTSAPVGDLDSDCTVGILDLLALLGSWGECPGNCPADLDGDGNVGVTDLLIMLANWG